MTTESNEHNQPKAFLSPEELAEFLSVSKATVYRLAGRRKLPFHRIGGMLRFKRQEVEKYLEDERFDPVKF